MTIALSDLLRPDHVIARLKAGDKPRLLAELARRAAADAGRSAPELAALLAAREALGSTGVGAGIAVPHARVEGLPAPTGLFARLDRAIDYESIDGQPVDLVFLLLSPTQEAGGHLAALAAVSRRLRDRKIADALRRTDDPARMQALLVGEE
jgi:PTS system nitrogen regulatory IIA component